MKYVCHFSCGVTSAVMTMITVMEHGRENVEVVYADPGSEHEDNKRFMKDFMALTNIKVKVLKSEEYNDIYEVFDKNRFLSSPNGAPCTLALKKKVIEDYLRDRLLTEVQVLGFTGEERGRIDKWRKNNPMVKLACPLDDAMLDKRDCMAICGTLGLRLPEMYRKGYSNANCIGCIKASSVGYWAAIRLDFPSVFNETIKRERSFGRLEEDGTRRGAAICKKYRKATDQEIKDGLADKRGNFRERVFLDEIPEDFPPKRNVSISCGYSCGMQDMEEIEDELTGEPSFFAYDYESRILAYFAK